MRRTWRFASRSRISSRSARTDAVEARKKAIEERDHSRRLSAGLSLEKGIALAQEGHADRGLLWMLEALATAPEDPEEFRKLVRWNLGAWLGQVHETLRIIDVGSHRTDVAFSPDGRSFALGFNPYDHAIATPIDIWGTASGQRLSSLPGALAPFAFRPDGKVLVTHDGQGRVVARELGAGRVLWTTPQPLGRIWEKIEFTPDASTVLVMCHDTDDAGSLSRLDARTGRRLGDPIPSRGWAAATPDGRIVATRRVEDGRAYIDVLDLAAGRRMASWRADSDRVHYLLFSPDGRSLFASDRRGLVLSPRSYSGQVWDPSTGRPTTPPMASTKIAVYSPAADRLMTQTGNSWLVRDADDGRVRGSGYPFTYEDRLAAHPDGRTMLSSSGGEVYLWRISPDAEPLSGGDAQATTTAVESDGPSRNKTRPWAALWTDGRIAIAPRRGAGERDLIRISDPATGRPIGRPASHYPGWSIRSLAISPDRKSFATGTHPFNATGEVRIWDASTGRLRFSPMPHTNYVSALAFHPGGKVLAAGDFNGLVRTWDTATGREIGRPLAQGEIVMSLAFSPDGKVLAVGLAIDRTGKPGVRLWDTGTRRAIGGLLPSSRTVDRIDFRPDGRALLAGDEGHTTRVWDVAQGRAIGEPLLEEQPGGFRPDGQAFLTVGGDGTIKLRDGASGAFLASLLTTSSRAICAAFRSDGGLVVAGFEDGTVRLCDPATSQPVGPPRSMGHPVHHVAFTPDGRTIAAIDDSGESRTWPVPEPLPDAGIDDLTLRIEARTGLRMETGRSIDRLDATAWRDRLDRLARLDSAAVRTDDDAAWHEPMIREAEANGHAFAAIWHLDRLIAARPDDWYLHARRAHAWSSSDRFDRAVADYRQAERLGSRERVLDFQAQCVVDSTEAGRWAEALWYLDRLIAARPDDTTLHEDRAAVYGKLGREADRQAELARVFAMGADQGMVIPRAEELGRAGRWPEAAGLLMRCGRTGPLSRELAQAWAIACLEAGDRRGYREACAAVMARQGPDPTVVWDALASAWQATLGAGGLADYGPAIGWFERRLSDVPAPRPFYRHLYSNALGGLLFRAGRVDEAIVRLDAAIAAGEIEAPTDWSLLAMAHARKGNRAEARRWLERLRRLAPDPQSSYWDLRELDLLRSEAEAVLLDAEFPGDPFRNAGP